MNFLTHLILASILSATPLPQTADTIFNGLVEDLTGTPVPSGTVTFTLKPGVDTTVSGNARFTPTSVVCQIENAPVVSTSGTGTITVVLGVSEPWQVGDSILFAGTADSALNANSVLGPFVITGGSGNTFTFTLTGTHTNGAQGTVGGIYASSGTGPCQVIQNATLNPAYTSYSVAIQPQGMTTSTFNTYAIGAGPIDISQIVPTPSQQPAYSFVDLFSNGQTISGSKYFTNTFNTYSGGTFNNPILNNATFNGTTATNWLFVTPTIQAPTFTTQPITLGSANNYAINWISPIAARSLTIQDPGGADMFVFANMVQTLLNKTLGTGTVISKPPVSVNGSATVGDYGVVPIVAKVDLTAQTASLGPTTLYTYTEVAAQSLAVVAFDMLTTTAAGSGTVTLQFNWTDCSGTAQIWEPYNAYEMTNGTIALASTGGGSTQAGTMAACLQSGSSITYTTTDSSPGTGKYDLHLRVTLE